jgi:hypothetical protein
VRVCWGGGELAGGGGVSSWLSCRCAVLVTLGKLGEKEAGHMPSAVAVVVVGLFRDLRGIATAYCSTGW